MKLFQRRRKLAVQITHGGLSVENADENFAATLVQFWVQEFGAIEEAKRNPMGFSMDHMSDLESDTMRIGPGREPEDDDDDDDEEGAY